VRLGKPVSAGAPPVPLERTAREGLDARARAVRPEPVAAQRVKLEQVAEVHSQARAAGRRARVRPVREGIEVYPAVGLVGGNDGA
jgi:hypothetical protein